MVGFLLVDVVVLYSVVVDLLVVVGCLVDAVELNTVVVGSKVVMVDVGNIVVDIITDVVVGTRVDAVVKVGNVVAFVAYVWFLIPP